MSAARLPPEQRAEVERAATLLAAGKSAEGRAVLAPLLIGGGGRKSVCWSLAEHLEAAELPAVALPFARAATQFDLRDPELWDYVASLAKRARDRAAARDARRRARRARTITPWLDAIAAHEQRSEDAEVLALLQRCLEVTPDDPGLWMSAGATLGRLERYDEAVAAFTEVRTRFPSAPEAIEAIGAIARWLYAAQDSMRALEVYRAYDTHRAARYGAANARLTGHALLELRPLGIAAACDADARASCVRLEPTRTAHVPAPWYWPGWDRDALVEHPTPAIEVGRFVGAEVLGESGLVVVDDTLVLASEALDPGLRQPNVLEYTGMTRPGSVVVRRPVQVTRELDRAVLVGGRGASNYFHFLLELLPRVLFAEATAAGDDAPLLVNESMPAQHYEALERLAPGRERVPLEAHTRLRVGELIVPSFGGFIPDDTRVPLARMMIAPRTVSMLRHAMQPDVGEPSRRVALVRKSTRRRCINEADVLERLAADGFEIVDPLELSFSAQLELFAGASHVVMTCGAAQTNVVWMPPGSRLVVLWGQSVRPSYFSELGRAAGVETVFVRGKQVVGSHALALHRDFEIDVEQVLAALAAPSPPSSS